MTEILEIRERNALWIQSMSYIVSCGRIKGDIYAKYVREMRKNHKTEWTEIRGWKATFERFTSHLSRHPSPIWPSIVSFSTREAVLNGGHTTFSIRYRKLLLCKGKKELSWPYRTAFPIQNLWLAFSLQKLSCDFPDVSLVYEDGKYLQRRTRSSWRRRVLRKWAILHLYWEERLRRYEFPRSGVSPI